MPVIQAPNGTLQVLEVPGQGASNQLNIGSIEKIIRAKLFQGVNVEKIFRGAGADRKGNINVRGFGQGLERLNIFLEEKKLNKLFRKYCEPNGSTLNVKHFLSRVEGASTVGPRKTRRADAFESSDANKSGDGSGFFDKFTATPAKPRGRNAGPKVYKRNHEQPRLRRMGVNGAVKMVIEKLSLCKDLRGIVRRFDINRDGRLQKPEFNAVLESTGTFLDPADVTVVFEKFDPEGDGITYQDFKRIMSHTDMNTTTQWTRWASQEFKRLDTDHDGFLSLLQSFELLRQIKPLKVSSMEQVADAFGGRATVSEKDVLSFVSEGVESKARRSWFKAGGFRLDSENDKAQPPRPTVESKQSRGRRIVSEAKSYGRTEGKQVDPDEFVPGMYRPRAIDRRSLPAGGKKILRQDLTWKEKHLREVLSTKLSKSDRLISMCIRLDTDQDAALSRGQLKQALKSVDIKVDDNVLDIVLKQCAPNSGAAQAKQSDIPCVLLLERFLWNYAPAKFGNGTSKIVSGAHLAAMGVPRMTAVLRRCLQSHQRSDSILRSLWKEANKRLNTFRVDDSGTFSEGHKPQSPPAPSSAEAARVLSDVVRIALSLNGICFAQSDHAKLLHVVHQRYKSLPAISFLQATVPPAVHAFLDGLGINRGRYQGLLSQLQQQYTTNPTSTDSSEQRAQSTTASFLGLRRVQQRIRNALFPSTAARSKEESKKGGVANTGESAALRKLKATVRRIEEHDDTKLDEQTLRYLLAQLRLNFNSDDINLLLKFHAGKSPSLAVRSFADYYIEQEANRIAHERQLQQKTVYHHSKGLPKLGIGAIDKAISQKLAKPESRVDFVGFWKASVLRKQHSMKSDARMSPSAAAAASTLVYKTPINTKQLKEVLWNNNLRFCDQDIATLFSHVTGSRKSTSSTGTKKLRAWTPKSTSTLLVTSKGKRRESLVSRNSTSRPTRPQTSSSTLSMQTFLKRYGYDAASLCRPSRSPDAAALARRRAAAAKRSNEVVLGPKRVAQKLRKAVSASLKSDMRIATLLALTDTDGKGIVTREQLQHTLSEFQMGLSQKDFDTLWDKTLGRQGSNIINYDRFLRKFGATAAQQLQWQQQRWKLHGIRRQKHHAKFATVGLERTRQVLSQLLGTEDGRRTFVTVCSKEDRQRSGRVTLDQLDRALRMIPSLQISTVDLHYLIAAHGDEEATVDYIELAQQLAPLQAAGSGAVSGSSIATRHSGGTGKKKFSHNETSHPLERMPTERKWREADLQMRQILEEQKGGSEPVLGVERASELLRHKLFTNYTKVLRTFRRHDSKNVGIISVPHLHKLLTECKVHIARDDLDRVLEEYDDFVSGPKGDYYVKWKNFLDTVSGIDGKVNEIRRTKLSAHKQPVSRPFDIHQAHSNQMAERNDRNQKNAQVRAPSQNVATIRALLKEKLLQQPKKFERVMRQRDKDRDGKLTANEFQTALRDLDIVSRRIDVLNMMSAYGTSDGFIDWKQLSIELSNHFMVQGRMV